MTAYRWEKERSAWLLAHSRPGTSRRRQAELLKLRASRAERQASGVADTVLHEDVTPTLFRRMLATDEGSGEKLARMVFVPLMFGLTWLVIGPAIAIAAAIHRALWLRSPKIGRLWAWPWLAAGVVVGVAGGAGWHVSQVGPGMWFVPWPPALHVYLPIFVPTWLGSQLAIGLIITSLRIRSTGWAAVKPRSGLGKTGPRKNTDGTFQKVAEKDLIDLVPFVGDRKDEKTDQPAKAEPKPTALGVLAPGPETNDSEDEDEEIVFEDEIR